LGLDGLGRFTHTFQVAGLNAELSAAQPALIRTPDHRVRVFLSSTMGELAPERAAVSDVIRRLRLSPVLFELGARPHPPRALYRAYLEQSHIFVGLYWERYGWVAPDMTISGLEDEYRLCDDQPMLLYAKEPAPEREPRLAALLEEMQVRPNPPKLFSTPEHLAELVANDLALLLSARFAAPRQPTASETAAVVAAAVRQPPPLPPTPLVGRDSEVAAILDRLERPEVRLVTLSGPGGIGKSRLAVEVATRLQPEFPGGVVFTRLASVTDPDLVIPTIATAAAVHSEGTRDAFDGLVEALDDKPTLVVLDNFEHLLPAAPVLARLLEACPNLKVLVTSRAVLRLHGEWDHPVPPLDQPDAVRLFTERAIEARGGAPLAPSDNDAIAEICRRLDGLPLAIELAAARSRLLPPAALLRRLGNRLDMLTGGLADLPLRQQTLRGTIDWSYDLLDPPEQLLFARLSIFAGAWTLESAEDVCGGDGVDDVLGIMSTLLERSLISVAEGNNEVPRFRMLALLQEYARERLADFEPTEHTAQRHAAYLSRLAHAAEPHLRDREARQWDARLEDELENFRAAVTWLLDRKDYPAAVDLIWALSIHLWTADHLVEGRRWMQRAMEGIDTLDQRGTARLHFLVGGTAYEQGDYETARSSMTAALEGFRATGDQREQGSALTMLGATLPHFGEDDEAAALLHEAIALLEANDEDWSLAFALNALTALVARQDLDAAVATAAEALHTAERIDSLALIANALMQLGYLSVLRGDIRRARRLLERSATISLELQFREALSFCLDALGAVALREGDPARAAAALAGSEALRESIGAHVWPLLRIARDAIFTAVRSKLTDEEYAAARDLGRRLSHRELVTRALQHTPVATASSS
jgi:predicted ATPase